MTRYRANALVGLLVVISIIAVPAGMLLPTLSAVRDSARALQCANGLRSLQLANIANAVQWEGCFAPYFHATGGAGRNAVNAGWDHATELIALYTDDQATLESALRRNQLRPVAENHQAATTRSTVLSWG